MFRGTIVIRFLLLAMLAAYISSAKAGIWTDPCSFGVDITQGCEQTEILAVGNDGDGVLNFTLRSREISREILKRLAIGGAGVTTVKADNGRIILEYRFARPVIGRDEDYDTVGIKGLETYRQTGAPIVPVRPATILVPFGRKVEGVRVIPQDSFELPGTYLLEPAQRPYPLNYDGPMERTEPDPAVYNQAASWPGTDSERAGIQSKRGYQLFALNLFPVQYVPAAGTITYTTKMRVEVELAGSFETKVLRPSEAARSSLKRRVDNPRALGSYNNKEAPVEKLGGFSALPGGGSYEYVIITSEALESAAGPWNFQTLRDAKISRGLNATIVTTEWIYANYDGSKPSGGSDNQTRIRNFLIDAYQTWGTQYVLLGGTNAIVPARQFWVDSLAGEADYMPVDMYYGCVEPAACTFDFDADNRYGEPTDGVGGGDVDLYAEIYIGRAAVQDGVELANFIRKTLTYSSIYDDYLRRISMVGEHLGFGGVAEYAKPSMEQIRLGGTYDGYFTYGFENHTRPDFYDFDTSTNLYDADGTWSKSALIGLMNGGAHVFNHLGHASYTYCMKLYTSDLPMLTNDDYFFAYSQGCMPGGFDVTNCFAEVLTTMEHGAYAAVMNARYGWGMGGSTDGPSQRFARQFWDAAMGEDKLELGRANQDSKEDNLWDINGGCIRWCYYELNLFGDPEQKLRFEEACEWITFEPDGGTVGPGQWEDISVTFDAMELMPGVYGAEIVISSDDPGSSAIVPVTMTVSADALEVSPAEGFESSGSKGGPFEPECMTYTLSNSSGQSVDWTTLPTEDWLTITPAEGTIEPNSSVDVSVCINAGAELLDPNVYYDLLTFQNLDSGSVKQRSVVLTVKPPDMFTKSFETGGDFSGMSVTFLPNDSIAGYEACRDQAEEFPTDPNGGTYLSLGDDDYAQVVLADGQEVMFYGQSYDRFYVGSNGYITFGSGDNQYEGSLENHFDLPRISGYFTDLTPATSQEISFIQLDDRVAVTFKDVPAFGDKESKNSFQIEIFFGDGAIRMTWLELAEAEGAAGLSEGHGLPPEFFEESDFRAYPICWPLGDFDKDYDVDFMDLGIFVSYWLEDDCNFPMWCDRTDMDCSSTVEGADFSIFAWNWCVVKSTMPPPIAHWKFDEGDGDIAYDSAGNNDGQLMNGPVWTSGQIDGALSFDGVDDYVEMGDTVRNYLGTDYTVSAWIKTDTLSSNHEIAAYRDSQGYSVQSPVLFQLDQQNSDIRFIVGDISHPILFATYTGVLTTGTWYHVAGVRQGDNLNVYVNAVSGVPASGTLDEMINADNLKIGALECCGGSADHFFDGIIDDVRVYNVALSAEEIKQLYQEGRSRKASDPNPADGARGIDPNATLSWTPGKGALSHDIYFGTSFDDVNDADIYDPNIYMGNQEENYWDVNSYDPNGLELDTTFYWRIDEVGAAITTKGDVWSFRTVIEAGFMSWWKFDEGTGDIAYDSAGNNHGSVSGASWTAGQIDGALAFDGVNDYVLVPDDESQQIKTNQITLSAWIWLAADAGEDTQRRIICKQQTSSRTWALLIAERDYAGNGNKVFFHDSSGTAASLCYSSSSLIIDRWYHVCVSDNAGKIRIYIDGLLDETYDEGYGIPAQIAAPIAIGENPDSRFFFEGNIDDVRVYNRALSAEEIWRLYQEGLSRKASDPNPADGARGIDPNVILSWTSGEGALSHDIYFGTDFGEVNDADIYDPNIYMGSQEENYWDVRNYAPNGLEPDTMFYWRVDEVGDAIVTKGDVWSFTTYAEPNIEFGLVARWEFDEGTGDVAYDSIGDNDGTLVNNPVWTAGKINSALDFHGDDGVYILPSAGTDSPLNIYNKDMSISAWVKFRGGGGTIVARAKALYITYRLGIQENKACINTYTQGPGHWSLYAEQVLDTDVWYHLVGVFNRDEDLGRIYIDGIKKAEGAMTTDPLSSDAPTRIGCRNDTSDFTFDGVIDDVRIYDRVLSDEEIRLLYQVGLSRKASNPNPADGDAGVDPNVILSWTSGEGALSHDIYFGTSFNDVNDADIYDPNIYMGSQEENYWDVNNYAPKGLEPDTMFYWRIDEVGAAITTKGDVWIFTTSPGIDVNLVSLWKFDEGEGDIAYDSAGNNDGNLTNGPIWTAGRINGALDFDGVDDYVNIPDDVSLRFNQNDSFSICCWAHPTGSATYGNVFSKYRTGGAQNVFGYILCWSAAISAFDFRAEKSLVGSTSVCTPEGSAPVGDWYFVVAVYDNKDMTIYLNGQPSGNGVFAYNTGTTVPLHDATIGARGVDSTVDLYFTGMIDDVRVYDRALSGEEIWQLYQSGL